jgi:predicted RNA-binding protein Jag
MKSIIEQASSIIKAIEKAWNQAEKPKEFSIKIFEQEERNFFGMSTKPAKIGIFFGNDKPSTHEKPISRPQQKIKECRSSFVKTTEDRPSSPKVTPVIENKTNAKSVTQQPAQKVQSTSLRQTTPQAKHNNQPYSAEASFDKLRMSGGRPTAHATEKAQQPKAADTENKPHRIAATWNDTMITTTHNWLKQTLSLMGLPAVSFNSEVAGKNLKLTFAAPLIADPMQEKQLFRSFAHLIVSSLRNQYKQEIKNLKVVLIRPE